jgi:lipopolysaccharide export system permease protein
VLFDSYAFDLSRFSNTPQNIKYSVRERYLWDLFSPMTDDPLFADQPGQIRAELHDRLTAPLYPLAFVFVVYAYLGAPRTTRQARSMSLWGAISAISALRGVGFVGMLAGANTPIALALPYLALLAAFGLGYFAISRGVIIEAPAWVTTLMTAMAERAARRAHGLTGHAS